MSRIPAATTFRTFGAVNAQIPAKGRVMRTVTIESLYKNERILVLDFTFCSLILKLPKGQVQNKPYNVKERCCYIKEVTPEQIQMIEEMVARARVARHYRYMTRKRLTAFVRQLPPHAI